MVSAGLGIILGVAGSAVLTNLLRGMRFSVVPLDGPTFAAVSALMFATAMLASFVPAHRATRVDPLTALRGDQG